MVSAVRAHLSDDDVICESAACQRRRAAADLVGQGRQADRHTLMLGRDHQLVTLGI